MVDPEDPSVQVSLTPEKSFALQVVWFRQEVVLRPQFLLWTQSSILDAPEALHFSPWIHPGACQLILGSACRGGGFRHPD